MQVEETVKKYLLEGLLIVRSPTKKPQPESSPSEMVREPATNLSTARRRPCALITQFNTGHNYPFSHQQLAKVNKVMGPLRPQAFENNRMMNR